MIANSVAFSEFNYVVNRFFCMVANLGFVVNQAALLGVVLVVA